MQLQTHLAFEKGDERVTLKTGANKLRDIQSLNAKNKHLGPTSDAIERLDKLAIGDPANRSQITDARDSAANILNQIEAEKKQPEGEKRWGDVDLVPVREALELLEDGQKQLQDSNDPDGVNVSTDA